MSDRLAELLRQRALLQEHLAWLNREISEATGTTPNVPLPPKPAEMPFPAIPARPTLPVIRVAPLAMAVPAGSTVVAVTPLEASREAEVILDQFRTQPTALKQDVRKGCFLYLLAAFALLGLGVMGLYFAISSR